MAGVSIDLDIDLSTYQRKLQQAVDEFGRAIKKIDGTVIKDPLADAFGNIGIKPIKQVEQEIQKVKRSLETIKSSGTVAGKELERAMGAANAKIKDLNASMGKGFSLGNLSNAFNAAGGGVRGLAASVGALPPAFLAAAGAAAALVSAFNLTKAIDQTDKLLNRIAFTSSNTQEYQAALATITEKSNQYGLSLNAQVEQYSKLAASTAGTSLAGEKTREIWEGLAVASAGAGLSMERQKLVMDAVAQIAGKGVVSMEELRQQLGDSLPGAVNIAARAMGMTTQEFNKAVESGKVLSEDFLPKLAAEMKKTFGDLATQNAGTFTGAMTRIGNVWDSVIIKMSESNATKPVVDKINEIANAVMDFASSPAFDSAVQVFSEAFGLILDVVVGAIDVIGGALDKMWQVFDGVLGGITSIISEFTGSTDESINQQISGWDFLINFMQSLRAIFATIMQSLVIIVSQSGALISAAYQNMAHGVRSSVIFIKKWLTVFANGVGGATAFVKGVVAEVGNAFAALGNLASAVFNKDWAGVKAAWAQLGNTMKASISVAAKTYKDVADANEKADIEAVAAYKQSTAKLEAQAKERGAKLLETTIKAQDKIGAAWANVGTRSAGKNRKTAGIEKAIAGEPQAGGKIGADKAARNAKRAAEKAAKEQEDLDKAITASTAAQAEARKKIREDELKFEEELAKRRLDAGASSIEQYNAKMAAIQAERTQMIRDDFARKLDELNNQRAKIESELASGGISATQAATQFNQLEAKKVKLEADIAISEQSAREARIKLRDEVNKQTRESDAILLKIGYEFDAQSGGVAEAKAQIQEELNARLAEIKKRSDLEASVASSLTAQANAIALQKTTLAEISAQKQIDATATLALETQLAQIEAQKSQGKITESQYDAQKLAIERELYNLKLQQLNLELQRLQTLPQTNAIKQQELEIQKQIATLEQQEPKKSNVWYDTLKSHLDQVGLSAQNVANVLTNNINTAIDSMIDGSKSAKEAFKDFARQTLISLAQMIVKQIAYNTVLAITKALGGGGFSDGGLVGVSPQKLADGGSVRGAGTDTSDSIPAFLSNNEFVQPAKAVKHYGVGFMEAIRKMQLPKIGFKEGGLANLSRHQAVQKFAAGGMVQAQAAPSVQVVVNNSGTPQRITNQQVDYDSARGMIIRIMTEDAQNGGTISRTLANSAAFGVR